MYFANVFNYASLLNVRVLEASLSNRGRGCERAPFVEESATSFELSESTK